MLVFRDSTGNQSATRRVGTSKALNPYRRLGTSNISRTREVLEVLSDPIPHYAHYTSRVYG